MAPAFHTGGETLRSLIVSNTDVVLSMCQAIFLHRLILFNPHNETER